MAVLDGKITIGIDYRPCMVHIPEKVRFKKNTSTVPGDYIIESPECYIKALFHCWSHRSEVVGESYLRGGHPGGQVSGTFAIVEYEDGTVHEVELQNIRFVDNAMAEYPFSETSKEVRKQREAERYCSECKNGIMQRDDI